MKAVITRCEEMCGKDEKYPLVLRANIDDESMQFSFFYRLNVSGETHKKVDGILDSHGMSSRNVLEDEDADDYIAEAEQESVSALVDYFRDQFPSMPISGTVKSTFKSMYHTPSAYDLYKYYNRLTRKQQEQLRAKINQVVSLHVIHSRCMPNVIPITFLGIYGIEQSPLFVHGRNDNDEETIWRNVSWTTSDEDTGLEVSQYNGSIHEIDDIDVSRAFSYGQSEYGRGSSPVNHLFGYRDEITKNGIASLNWGTLMNDTKKTIIDEVKKLERII